MLTIPAPVRQAPSVTASPLAGKAGPVGPGAGALMTEYLLPTVLGSEPAQRMGRALKLGWEIDWIRSAERVIGARIAGCRWHLEDPEGQTIDDEWDGPPLALDARALIDDPQREIPLSGTGATGLRVSRRAFLRATSRHQGLAGQGAWYEDVLDGNGCPHALLSIRPDRLWPDVSADGVLLGWRLDRRPGYAGTPLELDRLHLVQLEPSDSGIFAPGLVESAMAKAINSGLIDRHYSALLASGGRISGILAPKEGAIEDDGVYQQTLRDWRNVVEQPEAARRLQIVRAPVDFTSTVMDAKDMQILELMSANRDALMALWGVPLTMLNGQNAGSTGLNGGDSRAYDEAALWQGAVHDRLVEIRETFQLILDRWEAPLGWAPRLCFDEPSFDDESPAYDRAKTAQYLPLRNSERRSLVGLDPFGVPELDDAVWMPATIVQLAVAPLDDDGVEVVLPSVPLPAPSPAAPMLPALEPVKGAPIMRIGAAGIRRSLDARITPRVQATVQAALRVQRDAVADAVEQHWDAIATHNGNDASQWWRDDDAMSRALAPAIGTAARQVALHIGEAMR